LRVADDGVGMSAETQARAFDPFFTTKSAGRGLGLAVVQGIVRSLGGTIRIETRSGEGTEFDVLLPCCESPAERPSVPQGSISEAPAAERPATILFVEDEETLRLGAAKMLRNVGFEVVEAATGSAAVDLLHSHGGAIDAILLDMTIPGRSSADVLAEAGAVRPGIRVLLTSAYSEEMVMDGLDSPLVRGFIRKPFRLAALADRLRGILAHA
jgi:two-component system, cell cycle sensor histidine kinase and response regulator CckA